MNDDTFPYRLEMHIGELLDGDKVIEVSLKGIYKPINYLTQQQIAKQTSLSTIMYIVNTMVNSLLEQCKMN